MTPSADCNATSCWMSGLCSWFVEGEEGGGGGTKRAGGDREIERKDRQTERHTERQTERRLSIRWRCLLNECFCPRTDLERTDHVQDIKVRAVC